MGARRDSVSIIHCREGEVNLKCKKEFQTLIYFKRERKRIMLSPLVIIIRVPPGESMNVLITLTDHTKQKGERYE